MTTLQQLDKHTTVEFDAESYRIKCLLCEIFIVNFRQESRQLVSMNMDAQTNRGGWQVKVQIALLVDTTNCYLYFKGGMSVPEKISD